MMIAGFAVVPLFAALDLAIDGGRGHTLKSKLSYPIDADGPAGDRAFENDNRTADIMIALLALGRHPPATAPVATPLGAGPSSPA